MFSSICFPNLKKNPITLQIHIISVISIDTAPCIVRDLKGNFCVRLDKFWIINLLCKVTLVFFCGYHDIPWAFQTLLKLEKNSTADIMSWLTAPRWQMIWGCFRSFAFQRIRALPDLMMDTHRRIAIGRNCRLFRITRVHFRLFGSLRCSCAFVIFCVISVGCCWFVSVLPWFIFCPRLLFFYNPSRAMAIS